jgi:hypothetical protein
MGIIPIEKVWIGKCNVCKSEVEATTDELKNITTKLFREGGHFSWEKCPICGSGTATGYGGMLFYPKLTVKSTKQNYD